MSETKALIIGDPHFKTSNVAETTAMLSSIINILEVTSVDFIVVLGDIQDRHETVHVSPLTRSVKFLTTLSMYAPTYVLIGNHDLKNNRQFLSDEHPFVALKYINNNNLQIIDTTTITTINGLKFTFVPYVPPGRFLEALNFPDIPWLDSTCIFAHQEFKGAQMGAIVSIEGDDWDPTYPQVISGHIHDYQQLGPNITYIGTPFQHTFGDRHDKSIAHVVFNENSEMQLTRRDLKIRKKHIIHLNVDDVNDYVPIVDADLKIVISGVSGELKSLMKNIKVEQWKRAGHKVVFKDIPLTTPVTFSDNSSVPKKFSIVLYESVKRDDRLFNTYQSVFGLETSVSQIESQIKLLKV